MLRLAVLLPLLARFSSTYSQCSPNPCENGGRCEINPTKPLPDTKPQRGAKFFDYKCQCQEGFTGNKCQWPCLDVYKSCDALWKNESRCTIYRKWTTWYDVNCPITCGVCRSRDGKAPRNRPPFPPILEPIMWLIGKWRSDITDDLNFPVDFDTPGPFVSELEFAVAQVPMFGTPVLNYSSVSYRNADPSDRQVEVGFISVKDRWRVYPVNVALMRTSNNGAILFEEGESDFASGTMDLNLTYWKAAPTVKHKFPVAATRRIALRRDTLVIEGQRRKLNEPTVSFIHYYRRIDTDDRIRDFEPTPATAPPPTLPDISGVGAGDPVPEEELKIAGVIP